MPFLQESYDQRFFSNFGPVNSRFEQALADRYATTRGVVTASSATTGLIGVLAALDIRDKRVVLPSFTFVATGQAVLNAGGIPVFCDVQDETWELDPVALEHLLQSQSIAAVIHVRAFGLGQDVTPTASVCQAYGVPLVIDAAAAFGVQEHGAEHVGQQGVAEVFSLHATKVAAIGEGGAVFADEALIDKVRQALNFSIDGRDVVADGTNGKLADVHAAIGLAMLATLDEHLAHRRTVAGWYADRVATIPGLSAPWPLAMSSWSTFLTRLAAGKNADQVLAAAAEKGVELRRGYTLPLHRMTRFMGYSPAALPVTDRLSEQVICLPLYADMTPAEVDDITEVVRGAVAAA